MNLLVVSTWSPFPADNGSRLRAWHLLRELSKSHSIRLVAGWQDDSADGVPDELAQLCSSVTAVPWKWHRPGGGAVRALLSPIPRSILETPNPAMTQAIASEIARAPDAVLGMELGVDAYLPAGKFSIPTVLDQVEVSGMEAAWRGASGRERAERWLTWAKGVRYWQSRLARYAALTAVSDAEAAAVRTVAGPDTPVHVVPNGVDVAHYASAPGVKSRVPGRMLYNGALSYGPNLEAVEWFVSCILPRIVERVPGAHLAVTGRADRAPESLRSHPHVTLTGFLPDIRTALDDASLCVIPLRRGGGTRLKLLEAWAAGVPVVSTTIGASGLDATQGKNARLADDPETFADAAVDLLAHPAIGEALARRGRALVETQYDWGKIVANLNRLLQGVGG